jgi:hypothetical protein
MHRNSSSLGSRRELREGRRVGKLTTHSRCGGGQHK